jgi:hypothetical protein
MYLCVHPRRSRSNSKRVGAQVANHPGNPPQCTGAMVGIRIRVATHLTNKLLAPSGYQSGLHDFNEDTGPFRFLFWGEPCFSSKDWPSEDGGRCWIRTSEGVSQQIYSLPPLATWVTYRQKSGRQYAEGSGRCQRTGEGKTKQFWQRILKKYRRSSRAFPTKKAGRCRRSRQQKAR